MKNKNNISKLHIRVKLERELGVLKKTLINLFKSNENEFLNPVEIAYISTLNLHRKTTYFK